MLGPAAANNGLFWAGSELESVTTQSHRPHVAKGINHCTYKVTKHNSKRNGIKFLSDKCNMSPPIMLLFEEAHAATEIVIVVFTTSCNF